MFERFTDRARGVVVHAREESRLLGHDHIGTEHLLLGLVRESGGMAGQALASVGISLEAVRTRVAEVRGRGNRQSGHIPFTSQAKRAIELSLREALQLHDDHIGTEHILLGILRGGDQAATEVLVGMGTDLTELRDRVLQLRREGLVRESRPTPVETPVGRVAAVERWVGMVPDFTELDADIARLRQQKDSAIAAEDFPQAAAFRASEKQLLDERDRRSRELVAGPTLADEVARLRAEIERLHDLLRDHGIEPASDAE